MISFVQNRFCFFRTYVTEIKSKAKNDPKCDQPELQLPTDTYQQHRVLTLVHLTSGFLLPCGSDGAHDPAECRSGLLERSGSLLLCRGGPGCDRRVPAGALAGGPARALAVNNPQHSGPASARASLPGHQDHRLARWSVVGGWWR